MRLSTLTLLLAVQSASARKNAKHHKTRQMQDVQTSDNFDASHLTGDALDANDISGLGADDLGALNDQVEQEIKDLESEVSKLEELLEGPESDGTDDPDVCDQAAIGDALADPTTCEPGKKAVQDGCDVDCEDCFSGDAEPCLIDDMDVVFTVLGSCADYECHCEEGKMLNSDDTACVCIEPKSCPDGMEWDDDDCECEEIKVEKAERVKPEKPQKPDKLDKPDNGKKPVKRNLRA